jgi:transcriptional regulator with XRE-family HTH domain
VTTKPDSVAAPESPRNFIGRNVSRLRYRRAWTQDQLVAKLQIHGCDITRDILASVETLRSTATDKQVWYLAVVFDVDLQELYRPLARNVSKAKPVGIAAPVANRRRSDGPPRTAEP